MSRLLHDGFVRLSKGGTFEDTDPVTIEECPAGSQVYGDILDYTAGFMFGQIIQNNDAIAHNWRGFLRGTGIPGGEVELGTPGAAAPYLVNNLAAADNDVSSPKLFCLMPGQRFDLEMVEAVNTTPPAWQTDQMQRLIQAIVVQGRVPGNQCDLVNDGAPSIVQGPPVGARLRKVSCSPFANNFGTPQSFFMNRDFSGGGGDAKTVTVTIVDPVNGDRVVLVHSVNSGVIDLTPEQSWELEQGQSLKLEVAEATLTTDPVVFWYFEDLL